MNRRTNEGTVIRTDGQTDGWTAEVLAGRFKDNKNYLDRYYKDDTFAGLQLIQAACDEAKITMLDATFAWMLRHSKLGADDGLLLGASRVSQLEQNLASCAIDAGFTLPASVLAAFDAAWEGCRTGAFAYWRSYSADQPGREGMDQGGEYSAAKK